MRKGNLVIPWPDWTCESSDRVNTDVASPLRTRDCEKLRKLRLLSWKKNGSRVKFHLILGRADIIPGTILIPKRSHPFDPIGPHLERHLCHSPENQYRPHFHCCSIHKHLDEDRPQEFLSQKEKWLDLTIRFLETNLRFLETNLRDVGFLSMPAQGISMES